MVNISIKDVPDAWAETLRQRAAVEHLVGPDWTMDKPGLSVRF